MFDCTMKPKNPNKKTHGTYVQYTLGSNIFFLSLGNTSKVNGQHDYVASDFEQLFVIEVFIFK